MASFLSGWALLGLTFASLSYAMAVSEGRPANAWLTFSTNVSRSLIWAGLSPLVFALTRRFPLELRPLRLRNLLVHVPALLFFSAVHQTAYSAIVWSLGTPHGPQFPSVFAFYRASFLSSLYFNILIYTLVVIGSQAFLYYEEKRAAEANEARLKAHLAEAQLRVLKMQLHPHFLFNTLHSISTLVLKEPPKANQMIARLGDFLRLTLERSEHQFVMLKDEIELLRCYLGIEQVRFHDRLSVEFDVEPETLSARVPHLILQPVVENAIQHAIAPRAGPGHIKVAAKRTDEALRLEVRDTGPGISRHEDAGEKRGLGLSNVRARLEHLYAGRYRFELENAPEGGLTVRIEVPLEPGAADRPAEIQGGK